MTVVAFGTDGIRGTALTELTVEVAYALGRSVVEVLGADAVVVGRDTRISGPILSAALIAGIVDSGASALDVGVLPTPGVAHLCAVEGLPGAVVSASHNPFEDNGIKILSAGGTKLTDDEESAVAEALNVLLAEGVELPLLVEHPLDDHDVDAAATYVDHLVSVLGADGLAGLRVVVDCANGAATPVASEVLGRLGAVVEVLAADPDGTNRLGGAVVVTVMSNLGLHVALAEAGIEVVEVGVGDRNVLHALDDRGLVLGGEQSGHVIFRDLSTTGDGLLTGILLADLVQRSGRTLSALAAGAIELYPQVLVNVEVRQPIVLSDEVIVAAEAALAERLGTTGRVLLRPSGTEPLVRIMVEAADAEVARREADDLARLVADRLGSPTPWPNR